MFEKLTIRRQASVGEPLDLGSLAEALLFYGQVHIVADEGIIKYLIRAVGHEELQTLLASSALRVTYVSNLAGTLTQGTFDNERHDFGFFESPQHKPKKVIRHLLWEALGDRRKGNRTARSLIEKMSVERLPENLLPAAREDVQIASYTDAAAAGILRKWVPGYQLPQGFFFRVQKDGLGYGVETNLDYAAVNAEYSKVIPPSQSTVTAAYLLGHLLSVQEAIYYAATDAAELSTSETESQLLKIRLEELIKARSASQAQVSLFQEWIFREGRAIREAVNDGSRNFTDVVKLVEKAQRFKHWLAQLGQDQKLLEEYCREVSRLDWADSLPVKGVRWMLFTGAEVVITALAPVVGVVAGPVLGAGDAFLADRLVKGWKPNEFVEGPLRTFVQKGK